LLSNLGRLVIIYNVAGIIGSSFSKAFIKRNIEKWFHVTDFVHYIKIFLMQINSYVTDRPYSLVTEPANTPSSSKDIDAEETLAGFMKVSPEIVRPFPKSGPRKNGGRKHEKRRILTDTTEKTETEYQRAKKGKRKYSGKIL
jgi:hypothetical protein